MPVGRVVVEMGLNRRITRLAREAGEGTVLIRLQDGSIKAFDSLECWRAMFLTKVNLSCGRPIEPSPVLEAVRNATPESRAAFEAEYGEITMTTHIVASPQEGGWVEVRRLLEDGTVEHVRHEGDTPEAARLREEARQQPGAF
jgi:hypothetical protein